VWIALDRGGLGSALQEDLSGEETASQYIATCIQAIIRVLKDMLFVRDMLCAVGVSGASREIITS
jgi:hypothetical protein